MIDEDSLSAIGGWPWSRYAMARLTEQISDRGAVAIGLDFLFTEPDRQSPEEFLKVYPGELSPSAAAEVAALPSMDAIFARVVGRNPVVMARAGIDASSYDGIISSLHERPTPLGLTAEFEGPRPAALPQYPTAVAALGLLDDAALGNGLANAPADADGVIRRVPLLGRVGETLMPSFALELVRVAEGVDAIQLEGDRNGLDAVRVGRHRVQVDRDGALALRYAGVPDREGVRLEDYLTIPAVDFFRKGIPSDALKDSIVLVGLTAAGTSDVVTTPRDVDTYGLFVQAQVVDAILSGRSLTTPAWARAIPWCAGALLTIAAILFVPRTSLLVSLCAAGAAVIAAFGASALAFQTGALLEPLPVFMPPISAAAMIVAMLFVEGRGVQSRLRGALQAEVAALAAARSIQQAMLVPRQRLAELHPAVELDAVLEPARYIGGDLYDAFLISSTRLCFLVGDVSGKSVASALFMALSKAYARAWLSQPGLTLSDAMAAINDGLASDNGEEMFVTLLVGVLDLESGELELCRAGHEKPLVVSADGGARYLNVAGGLPLGVMGDMPYGSTAVCLAPGEILVIYTDGVTEAAAPDESFYGRERLPMAASAAYGAAGTIAAFIDQVVGEVRAFEAGQEATDDLAILALRRR